MKYLPTLFTVANIFLGIRALSLIVAGQLSTVFPLILVAAFFDFADGYFARRLKAATKIGAILDSVSDFICFVIVPSFYVFMAYKEQSWLLLKFSCLAYAMTGTARLIQCTVSSLKSDSQHGFFLGCPTTAAALCVIGALMIYDNLIFQTILLLICSFLMVFKIEYFSFSKIISQHYKQPFFFIYVLLLLPFCIIYGLKIISMLSFLYLISFPLKHIVYQYGLDFKDNQAPAVGIFPFAKGTRHIVLICAVFLLLSMLFLPFYLSVLYLIVFLIAAFSFRDPPRLYQWDKGKILSPADGRVITIQKVFNERTGSWFSKVSIFLSLFDVHVNRAPTKLRILRCEYHEGGNVDVRSPRAGDNEHNLFTFELEAGRKVLLKQIAGRFARRVVSYVKEGDVLSPGQKLGIILFGSRVELFLPEQARLLVREGDVVKAALTTIGVIKQEK